MATFRWSQCAGLLAGALMALGCSNNEIKTDEASAGTAEQGVTMPTHVNVGYWHNFYNSSVCPMRLTSVASYWDVIQVAFADNAGSGNVAFNLYTPKAGEPCTAMDSVQFKADIQTLKSQGKNVVLSLGGADGAISIGSATEETNFVSSIKSILTTWGFSGIDLDLESGSGVTHGSQIQARLQTAVANIHSWYASAPGLGGDMFLSMAPEHPYVHGAVVAYSGIWGAYIPIINGLRDQLDLLHVQLYNNSSVTTPPVAPYNGQNFPVDSVDNLVASAKMLIEGFQINGGSTFTGLPASKVAFGVPSGPKSSNPPFISTTTITNAYKCITANTNCQTLHMNANQPSFRGVMSWSINWDSYDVAKNTAGRVDFAAIKTAMGGGGGCTPTTSCAAKGAVCGSIFDGCNTITCGTCPSGQTCGGSNTCSTSCSPQTCAGLSAQCGAPSNGCGGTLSCGTCPNAGDNCSNSFQCVGNLKAHYPMDAFYGTQLPDATPNNFYAASTGVTQLATGAIGGAMVFDGTSSQATVPYGIHNVLAGQSGISISAWIKNDGPKTGCTGTNCQQNIYYSYTTSSSGGVVMRISENYELACAAMSKSTDKLQQVLYKYAWQGNWIHAVCVFDAAAKKINMYVNNKLVTNATVTWGSSTFVNANSSTNDYIGGGSSKYFDGAIDQLKLFNKALTVSEITNLYQEGGAVGCSPLTACATGKVCGTQADGCGGLINCGTCPSGQTCTSSNTCTSSCTPKTCAQAGAACGNPSDGCGGQLSCPACTSPQVCNASFQCASSCTPTTCAAAGKNCGTMSDGCSAQLNCGTCAAGYSCTNNVCVQGTGGGCTGLQEWSATEPWTNYTTSSQRTHDSHKWQCNNVGQCFREPGTSGAGWTDLGAC